MLHHATNQGTANLQPAASNIITALVTPSNFVLLLAIALPVKLKHLEPSCTQQLNQYATYKKCKSNAYPTQDTKTKQFLNTDAPISASKGIVPLVIIFMQSSYNNDYRYMLGVGSISRLISEPVLINELITEHGKMSSEGSLHTIDS